MLSYPLSKPWGREGTKSSCRQPDRGGRDALTGKWREIRSREEALHMASRGGWGFDPQEASSMEEEYSGEHENGAFSSMIKFFS